MNTSISFLKGLNDLIFKWSLSLKAWELKNKHFYCIQIITIEDKSRRTCIFECWLLKS